MGSSPASSSVSAAPTMSGPGFPPRHAGWSGILDEGAGRRGSRTSGPSTAAWPKRPHIADTVPKPYRTWAQNQAHAALLDVLAALPVVPWISNPHADRPQTAAACRRDPLRAVVRCRAA